MTTERVTPGATWPADAARFRGRISELSKGNTANLDTYQEAFDWIIGRLSPWTLAEAFGRALLADELERELAEARERIAFLEHEDAP